MPSHGDTVLSLAQKCLSAVPVVVLGSGASLQYGVGGMAALGDCLAKNIHPSDDSEKGPWNSFIADIKKNGDLEGALHRVTLPSSLETRVVEETRKMVLCDDQKVLRELAFGGLRLALADLLKHLLRTTHPSISIITTNYDRLAEYAADQAGAPHHSGFSHGYLRAFSEFPKNSPKWIEVLKVHGSLDWFFDASQLPVALPDSLSIPSGFTPVMVTPGVGKYQRTHDDPFRTIIARADTAFTNARSILSVGYGFRDGHIQPRMQKRIAYDKTPTVFLAMTLSPAIREFLKTCTNPFYLGLEKAGDKTRAYFLDEPDGVDVTGSIWELSAFLGATI